MLYNKLNLKIAEFAETDSARPALNGVLLENKKTTATNGHVLVEVENPQFDLSDYPKVGARVRKIKLNHNRVLPTELAKSLAKGIKRSSIPILETVAIGKKTNQEKTEMVYTDLSTTRKESFNNLDEYTKYPDVETVKPKGKPVFETNFSPKLLSQVFRFLERDAEKVSVKLQFFEHPGGHQLQIKTETPDIQKVYVLICGTRIE